MPICNNSYFRLAGYRMVFLYSAIVFQEFVVMLTKSGDGLFVTGFWLLVNLVQQIFPGPVKRSPDVISGCLVGIL